MGGRFRVAAFGCSQKSSGISPTVYNLEAILESTSKDPDPAHNLSPIFNDYPSDM